MAGLDAKRSLRVAERVRAELMDLLLRGAIRDPRAQDLVISSVRVTDDLGMARVYIRSMHDVGEDKAIEIVEVMGKAAGFLRRELGQRLQLRYVPSLEFFWDDVVDSGIRIESILDELKQERSDQSQQTRDDGEET